MAGFLASSRPPLSVDRRLYVARNPVSRGVTKRTHDIPGPEKSLPGGVLGMLPVGRTSVEAYVGILGVYPGKFGNHPGQPVGWFPSLQSDVRW